MQDQESVPVGLFGELCEEALASVVGAAPNAPAPAPTPAPAPAPAPGGQQQPQQPKQGEQQAPKPDARVRCGDDEVLFTGTNGQAGVWHCIKKK